MDNRGTREALVIEDAEAEILAVAKRAVYRLWSRTDYTQTVDGIIANAERRLPQNIADRIGVPLRAYARKTYDEQSEILRQHALFFALLLIAKDGEERRHAEKLERLTAKNLPTDLLKSPALAKEIAAQRMDALSMYKSAVPLNRYHKEYMETVRKRYDEIINDFARASYDTNVSLRNIAEMDVRYEYQKDMIANIREKHKLAWIEPHANCSERCEPYQGRLYSLDGTYGKTKSGEQYVPIEKAMNVNPVTIKSGPNAGKTVYNGCLTGFNCRHKLIAYREGNRPETIPAKVVEKGRKVNDNLRAYEREIRHAKRAALEYGNSPDGRRYREYAKKLTRQYEDYARKNDVAYYPDRLRLFDKYN